MNRLNSWCLCAALIWLATPNPGSAQTSPSLDLRLYAGVKITGSVGSIYVVQSTTNPAQTNSWVSVAFVQLPATNYLFVDTTVPAQGNRFYRALLQSPPTNMVFIPAGTFTMGSPTNEVDRNVNEGPQTRVTLSRGFWIGKYEVTQGEYLDVTGTNPSVFPGDLSRPVSSVSWPDATNYCWMLTQRELAAGRIPAGSQYRLPTEAEWECAARAGTSTRFSYGDDPGYASLTNYAWYFHEWRPDRSPGRTEAPQSRGDCTTCMETSGSGARIGWEICPAEWWLILKDLRPIPSGGKSFAAAVTTSASRTAGPPGAISLAVTRRSRFEPRLPRGAGLPLTEK